MVGLVAEPSGLALGIEETCHGHLSEYLHPGSGCGPQNLDMGVAADRIERSRDGRFSYWLGTSSATRRSARSISATSASSR